MWTRRLTLSIGGSLDGMFFDQDRVTAVQGRMADPNRADEIVMDAAAAQLLGVHVGQVVPLGLYTAAQRTCRGSALRAWCPAYEVRARLVGIVVLNNQVVQDDVDRPTALWC